MYTVQSAFLEHEGGSKFYEVVLIAGFDKAVLIRRWAAVAKRMGGGQIKIECGSHIKMAASFSNIIEQKKLPSHNYHVVPSPSFGMHPLNGQDNVSVPTLDEALSRHYGVEDKGRIFVAMISMGMDSDAVVTASPGPSGLPEPDAAQDAHWGSW